MSKALLHRMPSTSRYDKKYQVNGYDHLRVEAYYADAEDRKPEFGCWWVLDTRFSALDKYGRSIVMSANRLSDIRSWLKAGGASIWDPEKRIADKNWKPVPDGWLPDDSRMKAERQLPFKPFGEKGSRAHRMARVPEARQRKAVPVDPAGKKYAVVPGYVTSVNDGQKHWIGFGALTWLYGVKPSECIRIDDEAEHGWDDELRSRLIWLYPQRRHEEYESMKEELARGEDAFKLIEP